MEGKLDDVDVRMLKILQKNAKLTTKELAAEVNMSPTPVYERQRRLEREGFIRRYAAVVDPKKVGNNITVFCNICLKQHNREFGLAFMQAVASIEEIVECYNTSGSYDFMIKICARDMEHYQSFVLNKLGLIESIGSLHSVFVLGEVKNTHAVPVVGATKAGGGGVPAA